MRSYIAGCPQQGLQGFLIWNFRPVPDSSNNLWVGLSSSFTEIAGISKVFHGGAVCYHNDAKVQMLEVPESMLAQHGAVSEEVAIAMATGACEKFGADYGLSATGFAGPAGGTQVLPVGSIYLGYSSPVGVWAKKIQLRGDRASNRRRAATAALDWMRRKLRKYKFQLEQVLSRVVLMQW